MEARCTRLLGLEAPKYAPFLLEIEEDLCIIVAAPLGNLLDVEYLVVEVLHLQRGHPDAADKQEPYRLFAETP
jgi:hypothetical protein